MTLTCTTVIANPYQWRET